MALARHDAARADLPADAAPCFCAGLFGDLAADVFEVTVRQISAHPTRVGVNQSYFASGDNLAGIMDALRWKSPLYNRNLAAEQGAARRMLGKMR